MGSFAANLLEGNSVWLMLVGPPSSGKTQLLLSLMGVKGMLSLDSVDSKAVFISGTSSKDRAKNATGGVLREINGHGGIVMKDFTGILSLDKGKVKEILDVLRQVYDGSWTRGSGSDGGGRPEWEGKVALYAGVTNAIDSAHEVSSSLGERWVYWRMDMSDSIEYEITRRALQNASKKGWQKELQDAVTMFWLETDLAFGRLQLRRALTDAEMMRITDLGKITAMCRSAVIREHYKHEIISVKETEVQTRVTTVLAQLYIGMEYIGVSVKDRWVVLRKVALDSMPKLKQMILQQVIANTKEGGAGVTYKELEKIVGCSEGVVKRAVEDLILHEALAVISKEGMKSKIVLASEIKKRLTGVGALK